MGEPIGTVPDTTQLNIIQGGTFTFQLTKVDANDNPVSLAGYYCHMQIRANRNATAQLLADLSSTEDANDPGTAVDITMEPGSQTGVIEVRVPATATAALTPPAGAWYDLFLINASDDTDRERLLYGPVVVDISVTVNAG